MLVPIEDRDPGARDRLCGSTNHLVEFRRAFSPAQEKGWGGNSVELAGFKEPVRLDPCLTSNRRRSGDPVGLHGEL